MIVYIVWYQVKWNELKRILSNEEWISWEQNIHIVTKTHDENPTILPEYTWTTMTQPVITEVTNTTAKVTTGEVTTTGETKNDIVVLSWTNIYYGKIDIIEKLGIKYQYSLIDSTGTWFIYLGTPSYDFANIARALKGNIYTMATEQELIENKLFGNKVVFINIPEYKDKEVIMLIYTKNGIWLIQIDYTLYHQSKNYLKSLFID